MGSYYFTIRSMVKAEDQDEARQKMRAVVWAAGDAEGAGYSGGYAHAMEKDAPVNCRGATSWPDIIIEFLHGSEADRTRIRQLIASKGL